MAVPIDVEELSATTRNVSTTAVSFVSPRAFEVGVPLDFVLYVPDRESKFRMECHGKVVRCEQERENVFITSATIDVIRIGKLVIGAPAATP